MGEGKEAHPLPIRVLGVGPTASSGWTATYEQNPTTSDVLVLTRKNLLCYVTTEVGVGGGVSCF